MTNDPTLAGARFRHAIVESSADKTATAQSMAYLSHLDRADLLAEIERLRGIILSAQAYIEAVLALIAELERRRQSSAEGSLGEKDA